MTNGKNLLRIRAQPLTAAAFAPFGSIATLDTGGYSVNQGRARRVPGIRDLAHDMAAGRGVLDVYHVAPSTLPFTVVCFERHVLSSQVFIPVRDARLLIAVAPDRSDGQPDIARAAAFVSEGCGMIHYRAGVWHSPLIALDHAAIATMLMWEAGDPRDCEEIASPSPIEII
jgi:ureidoglycolate lyase